MRLPFLLLALVQRRRTTRIARRRAQFGKLVLKITDLGLVLPPLQLPTLSFLDETVLQHLNLHIRGWRRLMGLGTTAVR